MNLSSDGSLCRITSTINNSPNIMIVRVPDSELQKPKEHPYKLVWLVEKDNPPKSPSLYLESSDEEEPWETNLRKLKLSIETGTYTENGKKTMNEPKNLEPPELDRDYNRYPLKNNHREKYRYRTQRYRGTNSSSRKRNGYVPCNISNSFQKPQEHKMVNSSSGKRNFNVSRESSKSFQNSQEHQRTYSSPRKKKFNVPRRSSKHFQNSQRHQITNSSSGKRNFNDPSKNSNSFQHSSGNDVSPWLITPAAMINSIPNSFNPYPVYPPHYPPVVVDPQVPTPPFCESSVTAAAPGLLGDSPYSFHPPQFQNLNQSAIPDQNYCYEQAAVPETDFWSGNYQRPSSSNRSIPREQIANENFEHNSYHNNFRRRRRKNRMRWSRNPNDQNVRDHKTGHYKFEY